MNSYFIFAIVLTVAYIIYYAVIIAHDIYGKKGTDKPNEEVFDLGAPEEEESVAVTESETGFSMVARTTRRKVRLPLPKHPLRMSRTNRERRRRNWNG